MKKLAIAEGDVHLAKERYSHNNSVEWCEDDPPVFGKYDMVVLYNWLQKAEQPSVLKLLRYYVSLLKDGGELIAVVPSLDWACNEIALKDNPSVAAFVAVYGSPTDAHRCGFTMHWLRLVLETTPGLAIVSANTEGIMLQAGEGEKMYAQQNVIICVKVEPQPEEAIA